MTPPPPPPPWVPLPPPTPPPPPPALQELADALHGQAPDATTWLVPAEALWTALYYANALDVFGLDECDAATYTHPALRAEDHVQRQLLAQAPRTDAAMEAVAEAGWSCSRPSASCTPATSTRARAALPDLRNDLPVPDRARTGPGRTTLTT